MLDRHGLWIPESSKERLAGNLDDASDDRDPEWAGSGGTPSGGWWSINRCSMSSVGCWTRSWKSDEPLFLRTSLLHTGRMVTI